MKKIYLGLIALLMSTSGFAQRNTDILDRGLVAVPANTGGGNLISWRVFGEEYYDVTYNLYCNGSLLAEGLSASNYQHTGGNAASSYQVAAVVRGVEQAKSDPITRWANGMLTIPVQKITGRDGTDVTSLYSINDISMGDLDGDGIVEFIAKRPCSAAADVSQKNAFHVLDAYDHKGNRLWWIDLGPNMLSGADEQWDCVAYDWDQDGKAEVLLRIQDNAIIHYPDGTTLTIGNTSVDTRWNGVEYTSSGNEYLLYLEGATGKPYQIGDASHPDYMTYPLTRGNDTDWGTGIVGHRSTKHYFGAPFLDGRKASIFLGRGAYTKHKMVAYDVDPATHQLIRRWYWECNTAGPWFGQGYHNYAVGDVDWDGRDEIIFGSMIIDDNGKGLSTTGLGHGDAQHCSDFDPYRKMQEQFTCNETSPSNSYRNAATSEMYYRKAGGGDDGRGLMANFTNDYPGSVGRSVSSGWVSSVASKIISELNGDAFIGWGDLNQRIYWDGDLLDEYFDSPGTEGYGAIYKPTSNTTAGGRWNFPDSKCNNWSKNNPGAIGDIFGDWREELVMRNGANTAILVYTTGIPTAFRLPTLWHDHQYRNAMVWQSMGYNQPPHKSYFVGEMEGITQAPPSLTMTGRTEIANGGTINTTDEHLIVCETNDTEVSIADGASPYMVTFNVPSWVQGTAASNSTQSKPKIEYTYYVCNVTGGALTGATRVVKQGDGILNLPKVDMTYTGETNIWAGTLNFDGTMKNSDLWLNRFAELNSNGGVFKSLKADYAAIIRPGGADKVGTVTVLNTLTLGFGSRLVLDINGTDIDKVNCAKLVVEKKNWQYGPQYLAPVVELAGTLAEGKYLIGEVGELTGSLANIKIEGQGDFKAGLVLEGTQLYLTLGSVRGASHIVWTGSESNVWDYATTSNFYLLTDETQTPDVFVANDIVDFTDSAAKKSVTIKDEITLDTMYVNSDADYTFSGAGKIVAGAFVKEGAGTVTMSNDNTFTGGVFLRGGTTKVSTMASTTQAYGGLGGVVNNANNFVMENGAVLNPTAEVQNASIIRFSGEEGGVITNANTFTQQKAFVGTVLTKKGTGWMHLNVNNPSLNRLVIQAGTVAATASPAKAVEMRGGSINLAGGSTTPIEIAAGKKAAINYTDNRGTYTNALTGEGTVTVYYPVVPGSGWYATRCAVNGNWSAFEGTIIPTAATADDGRFCINNANGAAKATFNIPSGTVVESTGRSYTIGQVTGEGSLGGTCSLSSSAAASWATWNVGNDEDFTFKGKVTRNAIFNKKGEGVMIVSAAWDNTGAVAIQNGAIKLTGNTSLGTGTLTIASGARLTGTNKTTATLTNSKVTVNGSVQPGALANSAIGTLYFGGKNVEFKSGSTLRIGLRRCATATNTGGTSIQDINRLTMNGTISVFLDDGYEPVDGDSMYVWKATTFSGTPEFDLPYVPNMRWDTSRISEGMLRLVYDPTSIENIPADADAEVTILTVGGAVADTYRASYADVDAVFQSNASVPSGIYMLRIKTANGTVVRKVVK